MHYVRSCRVAHVTFPTNHFHFIHSDQQLMGAGRRPYFEAQAMSVAVTVVLRCCPLWLLLSALAAGQCSDGSCSATCLPGKPQYSFCRFCSLEPLPLQHIPRVNLTMKFILPLRSIGKRAVHILCGTRRLALDCSEVSFYYLC